MKALSVRQPWAYLICSGIKDIENRIWKTNYRGRVLIHAPVKWDDRFRCMNLMFSEKQWDFLSNELQNIMIKQPLKIFKTSAIIGSVEIINCQINSNSPWAEDDKYHWVLSRPVLFNEPVFNVRGQLRFWDYQGVIDHAT